MNFFAGFSYFDRSDGAYCNPVVEVSAYGSKRHTEIRKATLMAYFDHILSFELPNMTEEMLKAELIHVSDRFFFVLCVCLSNLIRSNFFLVSGKD